MVEHGVGTVRGSTPLYLAIYFRGCSKSPRPVNFDVGQHGRQTRLQSSENQLEIVTYNPDWPAAFDAEANRLRTALGPLALRIDHNGSTSIPGLSAKPIIDVQVSVAALRPMAPYEERLRSLGYVHVPHSDDSFCPFFHRPRQWPHSHHVHLVEAGGAEERRTLAFRDYLRDYSAAARSYEELKRDLARKLAATTHESREAYAQAKTEFIERVVEVALSSGYPRELLQGDVAQFVGR